MNATSKERLQQHMADVHELVRWDASKREMQLEHGTLGCSWRTNRGVGYERRHYGRGRQIQWGRAALREMSKRKEKRA
jgi:hypothetical protein